jgi:hypothetical protein
MLVVRDGAPLAQRTQEVGESLAGRVKVEVAERLVAPVPEAVDDERRHPRERPRRHDHALVLDAESDRQLTLEDVEEVGVMAMDVQVGALAAWAETRPRPVQRLVVGEDLDPPVRRVGDDLAASAGNQDRLAHEAE